MRRNGDRRNRLIGLALAAPFLLLGLAGWGAGLYPVAQHLRSAGWQPVPAVLLSLSESGAVTRIGEAHLTRPQGEFIYRWRGREYRGQQLYFGWMRDNFDSGWRERLADELGAPGTNISVWVNPANPAEAVACRSLRWLEIGMGLLGGSMFGAGGAALAYAALRRPSVGERRQGVYWPLVLVLTLSSPLWGTLASLLWRDDHYLWATAAALPILLALNGIRVGIWERWHRC